MNLPSKPIITICSSAAFYKQAVAVQEQLQKLGVTTVLPYTAEKMKQSNDFDVSHYKTWYENENDYHKKAALMQGHFDKIAAGDAILVLNYEKHGRAHYIGPNVLMEMALAFYLKKPIFVLNELPSDSPFEEELKGLMPVVLHGDAKALLAELGK